MYCWCFSPAPPTIKGASETSEVSVVLGFPTVLPCDVEGSPTPSITWLKDNQPIVSSPQLTYTRGGQALRLGSARGDSTGLYTCRATNPAGTATKHYSLSVLGKRVRYFSSSFSVLGKAAETEHWRFFCLFPLLISPTADRGWPYIFDVRWPGGESTDQWEFNSVLPGQRFPWAQGQMVQRWTGWCVVLTGSASLKPNLCF